MSFLCFVSRYQYEVENKYVVSISCTMKYNTNLNRMSEYPSPSTPAQTTSATNDNSTVTSVNETNSVEVKNSGIKSGRHKVANVDELLVNHFKVLSQCEVFTLIEPSMYQLLMRTFKIDHTGIIVYTRRRRKYWNTMIWRMIVSPI